MPHERRGENRGQQGSTPEEKHERPLSPEEGANPQRRQNGRARPTDDEREEMVFGDMSQLVGGRRFDVVVIKLLERSFMYQDSFVTGEHASRNAVDSGSPLPDDRSKFNIVVNRLPTRVAFVRGEFPRRPSVFDHRPGEPQHASEEQAATDDGSQRIPKDEQRASENGAQDCSAKYQQAPDRPTDRLFFVENVSNSYHRIMTTQIDSVDQIPANEAQYARDVEGGTKIRGRNSPLKIGGESEEHDHGECEPGFEN